GKGESTLIVYLTKLELGCASGVRSTRNPGDGERLCALRLAPGPLRCRRVSKVSITLRRLSGRRRGDRAANVTDCRSVSRGFDSLPRHLHVARPAELFDSTARPIS